MVGKKSLSVKDLLQILSSNFRMIYLFRPSYLGKVYQLSLVQFAEILTLELPLSVFAPKIIFGSLCTH